MGIVSGFIATEMERDEGGVCLPGQHSVGHKNEGISEFLLLYSCFHCLLFLSFFCAFHMCVIYS